MSANNSIPKSILRLLERRSKLAGNLMIVNQQLADYCEQIGMDIGDPDACLISDFRIYCEPDGAYSLTLDAIKKHLREKEATNV